MRGWGLFRPRLLQGRAARLGEGGYRRVDRAHNTRKRDHRTSHAEILLTHLCLFGVGSTRRPINKGMLRHPLAVRELILVTLRAQTIYVESELLGRLPMSYPIFLECSC
jgi:hypothetical protein